MRGRAGSRAGLETIYDKNRLSFKTAGDRNPVVQPVVSHSSVYANPTVILNCKIIKLSCMNLLSSTSFHGWMYMFVAVKQQTSKEMNLISKAKRNNDDLFN
jgi:hypothetical protein